MPEKKQDARVRYTKMMIRNSLLELLRTKPIAKITVTEICEMAGINRATFYAHYSGPSDLLHALENYPEIIALHKAYAEQELGGIDDALHLLVYDILHTAYTEQFYPKGYTRGSTSRERAKAVKEKADRAELCIRIGECEQELQELLANPAALPDLTGCKINHKWFGAGTVRPAEGQFMVIDFNGTLKKFSYTASMNSGYLSAEDPNVEARLQAYQDYNKDKDRLEKELKNLKAELVKL